MRWSAVLSSTSAFLEVALYRFSNLRGLATASGEVLQAGAGCRSGQFQGSVRVVAVSRLENLRYFRGCGWHGGWPAAFRDRLALLWTVDFGLWALDFGLWTLGFGLWAL